MKQLEQVLKLPRTPSSAFIILPEAVEDEMVRLEHEYQGLQEHQIERTEFRIERRPDGSIGPVVVRQVKK
jgi:hypothetical protein